ncbi:MAG: hypothetical protein AMS25_18425 [Gemmatimonas sp. SM23_52]|nr:MAG: hypothetical protein AMS25_18425 [Gemmatimonas sp. SM23_52]
MLRKACGLVALVVPLLAGPALAQQVAVDVNGFGGVYLPVTDWQFSDQVAQAAGFSEAVAQHSTAVLFGGRLTLWVTDVFGVEAGFAYALSDIEVEATTVGVGTENICGQEFAGEPFDCDASVWLASLKGLYRFAPQFGGIWAIHIGGGLAMIGRTGDIYDETEGTTDVGGVVNIGATFDVAPQVAIRLDVEDYLYSVKLEEEAGLELGDSQFQNDLIFTGGIVIKLGR